MRNPERIDYVCRHLAQFWKQCSDLRLGQLMWMVAGGDPFFIEDYDAINKLCSITHGVFDTANPPKYFLESNNTHPCDPTDENTHSLSESAKKEVKR